MADYSAAKISFGTPVTEKTLLDLYKDLAGTDGPSDVDITMYLQMAGEAAESYTQNALALDAVTEMMPYTSSPIVLRKHPYVGSLAVHIDGEDVTASCSVVRDGGLAIIHTQSVSASLGHEQVTITYEAGHDPLPAELGYCLARAAMTYEQQSSGVGQVKKENIVGVGSIEYTSAGEEEAAFGLFSAAQKTILDRYRVLSI